ncbi:DUF3999 domain-containing protein [Pseudomonas sp. DWP3-1-2]|uniref:DUF3999 domain-containing protein n=1 Tax=Pseudomonas sp. DWP3-1-2 TaxID=2804645 RepID=UPI003CFB78D2
MRVAFVSCQLLLKTVALGAALFATTLASAQDNLGDFASQTPLKLTGEGPWYRVDLPLSVQLNSRQNALGDVRVFNSEGQVQAYALTQSQSLPEANRPSTAVKVFPLYSTADSPDVAPGIRVQRTASGTVVEVQPQSDIEAGEEVLRGWLLDTSGIKQALETLTIDWSTEHEGFQRFSIEASDDLQHWQAWGDGQVARLSFADELVEQREVALPGRTARYLRLLWNPPQTAPNITSAQVHSTSTERPEVPLTWSSPVSGSVEKPGVYLWQLPTGLPVERLKFDIAQANSLAPGTLFGRRNGQDPWQPVSSGLLYRLTQNGQDVVQDELLLPGRRVSQLRLEVDERGGGLGNEAPQVRYAVSATQLVFLARGNGPFILASGNPAAKAADLPLGTLIPDYSVQKMNTLSRAEPASVPVIVAAPPESASDSIDWKRIGLWAVLVCGVAFLGWMAASTLRASAPKS